MISPNTFVELQNTIEYGWLPLVSMDKNEKSIGETKPKHNESLFGTRWNMNGYLLLLWIRMEDQLVKLSRVRVG